MGGEKADKMIFGIQNSEGMLVSIELRGSVEIFKVLLDSLFILDWFPWPAAPPCRARLVLVAPQAHLRLRVGQVPR